MPKKAHSFEYAKSYFEEQPCDLLEKKYINNHALMKYKCSCGNISKIGFWSFKKGSRCRKCMIERMSGEGHWNYNPNLTDEEREANETRHSDPAYMQWIRDVFKKDHYICKKCYKKSGKLNAHHKNGWRDYSYERHIVKNGATL